MKNAILSSTIPVVSMPILQPLGPVTLSILEPDWPARNVRREEKSFLLAAFLFDDLKLPPAISRLDKRCRGAIVQQMKEKSFSAAFGEELFVELSPSVPGAKALHFLQIFGLGARKGTALMELCAVYSAFLQKAGQHKVDKLIVVLTADRFDGMKTKPQRATAASYRARCTNLRSAVNVLRCRCAMEPNLRADSFAGEVAVICSPDDSAAVLTGLKLGCQQCQVCEDPQL